MTRLILASAADRSDAAAFAGRVARWDPVAPVRLVADGQRITLWAQTPFQVLASRSVEGRLQPSTVTVHATDLLAALAVSAADEVDPGRSADASWRARLPPADGWVDVQRVPVERISELVRAGTDAARQASEAVGVHAPRSMSPAIPAGVLDSAALELEGGGMRVTVPMRVLLALSGMGFAPDAAAEVVRVRASRVWLRLDARYGAVLRRRAGALPLLV